jgi:hypothetical protein
MFGGGAVWDAHMPPKASWSRKRRIHVANGWVCRASPLALGRVAHVSGCDRAQPRDLGRAERDRTAAPRKPRIPASMNRSATARTTIRAPRFAAIALHGSAGLCWSLEPETMSAGAEYVFRDNDARGAIHRAVPALCESRGTCNGCDVNRAVLSVRRRSLWAPTLGATR